MGKQQAPVKKNETVTVTFEDITHDGSGVGKVSDYPLFVPHGIPGEKATVKVVKVNKRFGYGKLLDVIEASPHRVEPPCNVFYKCGGCQLQHMSYELQLEIKQQQVKNVMRKIARLPNVPVHPVIGADDPWRYRNKIQMPVGEKNGQLITGFYQKRSHRIIDDMETCIIQNKVGDQIVEKVREIATQLGIRAYDERTHRGDLRHIITRTAFKTEETMVILVTRSVKLPQQQKLIAALTKEFPMVKSIIHNVNKQKTNVILGKDSRTIFGNDYIYDTVGNLTFKLSPRSFFQVNPPQTEKLYEQALEYAAVGPEDTVIDAYCGIGTISLFLAQSAKQVYGVEVVPEAVQDARENARINDIQNAEFVVGEAENIMPQWTAEGLRPDVIVVDPPRKGCDEKLLQAMIEMEPKRIVYVSCNPATLARDLRILEDGGYSTKEVQPVDMFSQTTHVELVALMSRV